jgi:hypothetical protein
VHIRGRDGKHHGANFRDRTLEVLSLKFATNPAVIPNAVRNLRLSFDGSSKNSACSCPTVYPQDPLYEKQPQILRRCAPQDDRPFSRETSEPDRLDDLQQEKNKNDRQNQAEAAATVITPSGSHAIAAVTESKDQDDQKNNQ